MLGGGDGEVDGGGDGEVDGGGGGGGVDGGGDGEADGGGGDGDGTWGGWAGLGGSGGGGDGGGSDGGCDGGGRGGVLGGRVHSVVGGAGGVGQTVGAPVGTAVGDAALTVLYDGAMYPQAEAVLQTELAMKLSRLVTVATGASPDNVEEQAASLMEAVVSDDDKYDLLNNEHDDLVSPMTDEIPQWVRDADEIDPDRR